MSRAAAAIPPVPPAPLARWRQALLLARIAGWAAALPLVRRRMDLPRLLGWLGTPSVASPPTPSYRHASVRLTRGLLRRVGRRNCLTESLVLWRLLRGTPGLTFCLGARADDAGAVKAHAWLEHHGHAWAEPDVPAETYRRLLTYPEAVDG